MAKFIEIPDSLSQELGKFSRNLQKSGYEIKSIGITELTDSMITLCIRTPQSTNWFYTVTKAYYELNVFKYDEFYKFGLAPNCIYQQFQTHRLDKYLQSHYRPIEKLLGKKALTWPKLVGSQVFEGLDLTQPNYGMDLVESDSFVLMQNSQIPSGLIPSAKSNWVKMLIQFALSDNQVYHPDQLVPGSNWKISLESLTAIFNNLQPGGLHYNHQLRAYCPVDLVDTIGIVEIILGNSISQSQFIEAVVKLVISNKQIINFLNPVTGRLYRIELTDRIKANVENAIGFK